jgi:hypothetical protein
MAQTTRSSGTSSSRGNSRTKRSTNRNASSRSARPSTARSSTRRSSSNASRTTASRRRSPSASRRAQSNGTLAKAGGRAAELASKAKGPLLAGGAALAGVAGGVALKSRDQNRRPLKRLSSVQLPKSLKNIDLSKIDLDKVTDAGRKVRSIGEQVGDVVDAADKTRKKHK